MGMPCEVPQGAEHVFGGLAGFAEACASRCALATLTLSLGYQK
jgi:hypothetical protein